MPHRPRIRTILLAVLIALTALSCATEKKQRLAREKFLQDHAQWRAALTDLKVESGMNLDALRWIRRSAPFGNKELVSHLWCDNVYVAQCPEQCGRCQGIVQMGAWIYMLEGKGSAPLVSASALDFVGVHNLPFEDLDYTAAAAVVQQQIQPGMTFESLSMLPIWEYYFKDYYCEQRKLKSHCDRDCAHCTLEIIHRGSERGVKTRVTLQPDGSQLKVVSVQTQRQESSAK